MTIVIANRDINHKGPVKAGQSIEIPDAELKAYLADGFALAEKEGDKLAEKPSEKKPEIKKRTKKAPEKP